MNTHVAHHYDSAADVDTSVRGKVITGAVEKPFAALDLNGSAGQSLFFLDSASIDLFAFKLDQLAVEMRKAEHAARQKAEESAVPV